MFGGTWEEWGSGKVPVGVNANETEFNAVEKTGGEKAHTLTIDEIPSHSHVLGEIWNTGGGEVTHYAPITGKMTREMNTGLNGGGKEHNNLQPYITCYMWKRVS